MDEIGKQNQKFCEWLHDIGKFEKVCANGKIFMINPKAIQTVMELNAFFKKKSDEYVSKCKSVGIECEPYEFYPANLNQDKPWMRFETYCVASNEDGISFSREEQKRFNEICSENVDVITYSANKYDGVSIYITINDFYIEVKQS